MRGKLTESVGNSANDNRTLWHVGPAPPPAPGTAPASEPTDAVTQYDPEAASPPPARERFSAGEIVPGTRYRVRRFLGDGGMGAVYEAEHVDLERAVALKVLLPRLCRSPEALTMFRSEARTASKVGADQIVELYDFAELDDGRLMFTMELLDGPTLADAVRSDGPLPPARVLGILRQLCKGLAAAHAAGVVHRDIKPDNIVLVHGRKDRADTVKILDFGIATILEDDGGPAPLSVGTPHYLAPELIAGTKFDQRSDVYAVGCTAYEMLTGRPPFVPREGRGLADILDQHVTERPQLPSDLRPSAKIPPKLETCVMRCLAKVPSSRFRSMDALEAALCQAQIAAGLVTPWDDLPVPEGIDPALRDRLLRDMPDPTLPPRRSGGRWIWPAVTVLALGVGGGATYWAVQRYGAAPAAAEPQQTEVDRLTAQARTAASRNYFVYPPTEDEDMETAYRTVRELENLSEPEAAAGRERARELRGEFAETLLRLGDEYWEREQGKSFAIDYYTQALVFQRGNVRAAQRAALSPEAIEAFERKAEQVDFTNEEIEAAQELVVLAEPETHERQRKLKSLRKRRRERGKAGAAQEPAGVEPGPAKAEGSAPDAEPAPEEPEPEPKPAEPSDPQAQMSAGELVSSARKLARGGDRKQAEVFFRRALTYDPDNAGALVGMYELEFNRGKWKAAASFAQRLVDRDPGNAKHQLKLGDARFKQGALSGARDAYQRAAYLGSARGKKRLAAVEAKLAPEADAKPEPAKTEDEPDPPEG